MTLTIFETWCAELAAGASKRCSSRTNSAGSKPDSTSKATAVSYSLPDKGVKLDRGLILGHRIDAFIGLSTAIRGLQYGFAIEHCAAARCSAAGSKWCREGESNPHGVATAGF